MTGPTLRIALASPPNAPDFAQRLEAVDRFLAEAAAREVAIVCFPEAYLPGLRGFDFPVPPPDQARQEAALARARWSAARHRVALILPMEWETALGRHNTAAVIDRDGTLLGWQAKNQLPLEEAPHYVPDGRRSLFAVDGVPFGITICHEGWRYPEATRWAAARGAKVVFHPQLTGSDTDPTAVTPARWGDPDAPYYEKAMILRAAENAVWFASVNYAFARQESATSVVDPDGACADHLPYGEAGLLVHDLDLDRATGLYARRYDPSFYPG